MYHCRILIHLAGSLNKFSGTIKAISLPEGISADYSEGILTDGAFGADVIFAGFEGEDENTVFEGVCALCDSKKPGSELIIAVSQGINLFSERFSRFDSEISDVWYLPMSSEEIEFRFSKWLCGLKTQLDKKLAENYLDAVINNSPSLIWFKSRDGIHELVNDSFAKAVNKPKEVIRGKRHGFIWGVPDDNEECMASDNQVINTGHMLVNEETVNSAQGERLLKTYKSPLYDFDGSIMGTVGMGIDITLERSYENEIIKKNRTLEKVFTSIDCGVLCHSVDGTKIISVNSAALRILGYESVEEMLSFGFSFVADSVFDEDKPLLREWMKMLVHEGDSVAIEYRVRHRDGKVLHIMGNIKLLRDESGELYYQRFLLDVTEQRLREHENEERTNQLIRALSEDYSLVCYFDLDTGEGYPLRVSDFDKYMFKSLSEDVLSYEESFERELESVHEDDRGIFSEVTDRSALKHALVTKNHVYLNYKMISGGTTRYFQMKAVRVGKSGVVLGFRCIDEEIRRELEKQDLLENALIQANRASEAKSTFLSNMSHDIRTPMNAIVGFTTLALTHLDDIDRVEQCLEKISISGEHLLNLINDVLDMSRIESGRVFLDEKPASLSDIVRGVRNILQPEAAKKNQTFNINIVNVYDEEVICDKLRLNQVLINLLSNSIKYTSEGGEIMFRISETMSALDGYANYEFLIKDNGIGMDREFLEKVFEPFERERNSTISGIQGTGLGMAITKNIVDIMNGAIEVHSEKGVGTEVMVTFQFKLCGDGGVYLNEPEFSGRKALVIDGSREFCEGAAAMLRRLGMRSDCALSGADGRALLSKHGDYSVVLIDFEIGDSDGIAEVRAIHETLGQALPIIMLSAGDIGGFENEAREAGVTQFCAKPLFLSDLRHCLESIFADSVHSVGGESEQHTAKVCSGRILMAEDNELNREIAELILTEAGFEVETAENGQMALEMLQARGADYYKLILMDVQMPVMNGYEATRAIRALDNRELASIPIIAMTANAFDEDRRTAIESGMNAHIPKPIDVNVLFNTLDKIM